MAPILEAFELVKQFGSIRAVDRISFSIEDGEIFSLLGPNGAGKTTTISILSTLIKPSQGNAIICGKSILTAPLEVRKCIGVIPQEIALYDSLSARENLHFWGQLYGLAGAELRKRGDQILEQVGLTDRAKDRVEVFSGGMKRRLNIGVGLLHQPRLLFMDEPTVGIDPQSRRSILDAVKGLNDNGLTVLYTTHYMEEAQEISDRVGIIDHGKMIALGTQHELTELVGKHESLVLRVGQDRPAAELAENLKSIPVVLKASANDGEVVLIVPKAEEALAPVITHANALDFHIRSVEIHEPNLEAVFLHLTGRALRD